MQEFLTVQNVQSVAVFKEYKFYDNFNSFMQENDESFAKTTLLNDKSKYYEDYTKFFSDNMYFKLWLKKYYNIEKVNKDSKIIGRISSNNDDKKWFLLNEAAGLFTELAKVNPFSEKDLLNFIKNFGLPTGYNEIEIGTEIVKNSPPIMIQFVNYSSLCNSILYYKSLFEIFKYIVTEDIDSILRRDKLLHSDFKKKNFYNSNDKLDILNSEKDYFYMQLNKQNILNFKFVRDFTDENESKVILHHENLIDFAFFQMFKALNNNSRFRICQNCNEIFEVTHEKMRFCPPLPFRKRSSCEMAYRNKQRKNS